MLGVAFGRDDEGGEVALANDLPELPFARRCSETGAARLRRAARRAQLRPTRDRAARPCAPGRACPSRPRPQRLTLQATPRAHPGRHRRSTQEPLPRRADQLPERFLHPRRQRQRLGSYPIPRYGLHSGPSSCRMTTSHSPRSLRPDKAGGPPPQVLRATDVMKGASAGRTSLAAGQFERRPLMEMLYATIDIHKHVFQAAVFDVASGEGRRGTLPGHPRAARRLGDGVAGQAGRGRDRGHQWPALGRPRAAVLGGVLRDAQARGQRIATGRMSGVSGAPLQAGRVTSDTP